MLVAIVLGNRLNDDGSITEIMSARLQLALEVEKQLSPDKIIVSGGVANPKAGKSEAEAMLQWLVAHGVEETKIVKEDNSMTTKQNAKYSVPIALQLGATTVVLCTTPEHMYRRFLSPVKLFQAKLKKYPNTALKICATVADISNIK